MLTVTPKADSVSVKVNVKLSRSPIKVSITPKIVDYQEIELKPLEVTENGVYEGGEENGKKVGFTPVTVNIKTVLEEKEIVENGEYLPNDGVDGFSKVSVNVQPDLQEKEIVENGEYTPDNEFDGFSKVAVNVPIPSDTTATAEDIKDGKTAYVGGEKVTGTLDTEAIYEAGKKAEYDRIVDSAKIIEKTVTGTGMIRVDDVSEIPHEFKIQLSSDSITDFSGITVKRMGVNLFDIDKAILTGCKREGNSIIGTSSACYVDILFPAGTYTISFKGLNEKHPGIFLVNGRKGDGYFASISETKNSTTFGYDASKDGYLRIKWFGVGNGISDIQIESGGMATEYSPYKEQTATANADGTVNGIESVSPTSVIICDDSNVNISMTYNQSYNQLYGVKTSNFAIWDSIQDGGARVDYESGFYRTKWRKSAFKPVYDIAPTNARTMFRLAHKKDEPISMSEVEKEQGIVFDFSKALSFYMTFAGSLFKQITTIDFSDKTGEYVQYTFYGGYGTSLERIDRLITNENTTLQNTTLGNCSNLKYIGFEGVIAKTIYITGSVLLPECVKRLFGCLKNYKGTEYEGTYSVKLNDYTWRDLEADSPAPHGGTWKDYLVNVLGWSY